MELCTGVFAHALHALEEDLKEMDAVSERVMEGSEKLLRKREREERGEGINTRDFLRALSDIGGHGGV
jgi:hypothetical protein